MESYKDRMRRKMQKSGMTSSQFLDGLTEFMCDTEGLTTEEIREDLEAKGIDTERLLNRTWCLLERYGFTPYP